MLDDLSRRESARGIISCPARPIPSGMRLVDPDRTPEFESRRCQDYLRGELFRVTGKEDSCNIISPGRSVHAYWRIVSAAPWSARETSWTFVIPNRHGKKDLVEFVADADREPRLGGA